MLTITVSAVANMTAHFQAVWPSEGCGFLGGINGRAERFYPVKNILNSSHAYRMDPAQQVAAYYAMRAAGQLPAAVCHSHPHGPATPSATDLAQATYAHLVYVIVAVADEHTAARPRGFRLMDGRSTEIRLEFVPSPA